MPDGAIFDYLCVPFSHAVRLASFVESVDPPSQQQRTDASLWLWVGGVGQVRQLRGNRPGRFLPGFVTNFAPHRASSSPRCIGSAFAMGPGLLQSRVPLQTASAPVDCHTR
eukprot:scaffold14006_cov107-Cylindrotheca_fusiformis.AAC.1